MSASGKPKRPLRMVILALGIVGLYFGFQGLWFSITNTRPTNVSLADLLQNPPSSGWYHITQGYLDLGQSGALTPDGTVAMPGRAAQYYVALHGLNESPDDVVHVFVRISDPSLIRDITSVRKGLAGMGNRQKAAAYMRRTQATTYRKVDVLGMVQPADSESTVRNVLVRVADNVDPNFTIINQGDKPSFGGSFFMIMVGVICALLSFLWWSNSEPRSRVKMVQGPPAALVPTTPAVVTAESQTSQSSDWARASVSSAAPRSQSERFDQSSYPQPSSVRRSAPFAAQGDYRQSGPFGQDPPATVDPPRQVPPSYLSSQPPAGPGSDSASRSAPSGALPADKMTSEKETAEPTPESFPPAFDPFGES